MENFMLALFKEEILIGYFHNETEINDYIKKTCIKRKKLKIIKTYPHF